MKTPYWATEMSEADIETARICARRSICLRKQAEGAHHTATFILHGGWDDDSEVQRAFEGALYAILKMRDDLIFNGG